MDIILILGVVVAALLVLVALGRGLFHFTQSHQAAIDGRLHENQMMQNKMMMARVKWQAITILFLILIGIFAAAA
jgi:Hypoxia induced protein conserved region